VTYVEVERSRFEKLVSQMGGAELESWINLKLGMVASDVLPASLVPGFAREAQRDLVWLTSAADQAKRSGNPYAAYVHCLCKIE